MPSPPQPGKLAIIRGIASRPELNGQLALVDAFDQAKGRFAARPVHKGAAGLLLKPESLVDWASLVEEGAPFKAKRRDLVEAVTSPARLVELMRAGGVLSREEDVARDVCQAMLQGGTLQYWREAFDGGAMEMAVQAIDAHADDFVRLRWSLFYVKNFLDAGSCFSSTPDVACLNLSEEAKDRAAPGMLERCVRLLRDDTTPIDLRPLVISGLSAVASGPAGASTAARRAAAARAGVLEVVLDAMRHSPNIAAMQHFGAEAIHSICATDEADSVGAWRADAAVRAGAHVLIIDAMARHGSDKMEAHEMAAPHEEKGVLLLTGDSILQTSIRALLCLASDDRSGQRRRALNAVGALKAVANAVRLNPPIPDPVERFNLAKTKKLEDCESIPQLIAKLLSAGDNPSALMDKEDYALLFVNDSGTGPPGIFTRAMQKAIDADGTQQC